jgi:hypothetical protein
MNTEENDTEAELAAWELLREARLELTAVTEQRDKLLEQKEQCRVSSVCREYREQRDRLAEALKIIKSYPSSDEYIYSTAIEALQSLTQSPNNA